MAEPQTSSFGFLVRKVGPLQVWMWAAIAVGGYYLWTHRSGATSPATTPAPGTDTTGTGTGGGSVTQNITEKITGPLTTTSLHQTGRGKPRNPCPGDMYWDPDANGGRGKCVPEPGKGRKRKKTSSRKPSGPPVKAPPGGRQIMCPVGYHKEIRGGKQVCVPDKPTTTKTSTSTTGGAPGPLVSTVANAGIVNQPAYLDTSGQYQREPARVPVLTYPVVPSAPGQPPVSPPDEAEPATQQAYAPQTVGATNASTVTSGPTATG